MVHRQTDSWPRGSMDMGVRRGAAPAGIPCPDEHVSSVLVLRGFLHEAIISR